MLVNMNEVLKNAAKERYSLGLFNTINLEMARAVLAAAEEKRSPVIIGTAEILLPYGPLEELSYFLIPMAKRASVPVVVHYDHGLTFEKCMEALKLGFSSIMYDCSTDTYEENVRKVRELTKIAHAFGATVEGELGHVGNNEGGGGDEVMSAEEMEAFYTDPLQAKDFVEKTGVDALAIAVGTAHGAYKFKPKLDFERISKIKELIDTPLVLHGGSGLSDDDFKKAIACGISKVNIFTDLNMAGFAAMQKAASDGKNCVTDAIPYQIEAMKEAVKIKMDLFGSPNRV
ncbi:MAG: class II fructose-bisphosphate aldolase [Lachnospiraceae bacterium]|nr:class II fructose-bisphosphate aldolase [Lachnospiraceae bacterium]